MGSLPFQNDMDLGNNPISSSFEEIKQKLDPDFSYVIFEKATEFNEGKDFSEIMHVFPTLREENPVWQIYRDKAKGKLL